uniref:Uncharacterized protein n=1 Tax=Aegilops tauschii subsp. strangulata TaxID=200361 RepID=A0A453E5I9_AEGTS
EHVESHLRLRRPDQRLLPPPPASFQEEAQPPGKSRPRRGGDRAVAAGADGDEPVRVRDLRQGVPAGPEPAAAPARPQPPLEAQAAEPQRGGAQEGVRVPGARVRPPRPLPRARRPHRHQEALQPQARREEVEVRQVRQALRRAVRLEGPLQGLRHPRVPMRLRHALLKAGQLHHAQGLLRRAGGGECEGRGCGRGGAAASGAASPSPTSPTMHLLPLLVAARRQAPPSAWDSGTRSSRRLSSVWTRDPVPIVTPAMPAPAAEV